MKINKLDPIAQDDDDLFESSRILTAEEIAEMDAFLKDHDIFD